MKKAVLFLVLFTIASIACAESDSSIVVKNIVLFGNKRTKDRIILREMDIHAGDTLWHSKIDTLFKLNRNRIYNTQLFNEVTLTLLPTDISHEKTLLVEVRERWYIFPSPILELADRSFNEWWYNQNRSLSRINYGVRFSDKNFRGRKEVLKLTLQGGFTTKLELGYTVPYLNKKQTLGMDIYLGYDQNKQVSYETMENKQQFLKSEDILRTRHRFSLNLYYRKSFFGTHSLEMGYNYNQVADTIQTLNPNYFLDNRQSQRYYYLSYSFTYDKRDVRAYAKRGYYFRGDVDQLGFTKVDDVHLTVFYLAFAKYFTLGHNFYLAASSKAKMYTPYNVPYFNMQALGYDQNYVRGYDLYVVDGKSFFLQRATLRKKLFEKEVNLNRIVRFEQFSIIPVAIYLNAFYDVGYVNSPGPYPGNEYLGNEWLRGGGFGMDLVTYYDSVIRFEYSFNKMLQHNLFLAFVTDI